MKSQISWKVYWFSGLTFGLKMPSIPSSPRTSIPTMIQFHRKTNKWTFKMEVHSFAFKAQHSSPITFSRIHRMVQFQPEHRIPLAAKVCNCIRKVAINDSSILLTLLLIGSWCDTKQSAWVCWLIRPQGTDRVLNNRKSTNICEVLLLSLQRSEESSSIGYDVVFDKSTNYLQLVQGCAKRVGTLKESLQNIEN